MKTGSEEIFGEVESCKDELNIGESDFIDLNCNKLFLSVMKFIR